MTPLTVVSMLWDGEPPDGETRYNVSHVEALQRQVSKHLTIPHDFVCLTDNIEQDFPPNVQPIEFPKDVAHWPKCYRKLILFSPAAKHLVGPFMFYLDLDTVILQNINTLITNHDFRAWQLKRDRSYAMTMFMLRAQSRPQVWSKFDLEKSPLQAKKFVGSDQAWVSYILGYGEAVWTTNNGVYSYKKHCKNKLPPDARIVHFHGSPKPWDLQLPWTSEPFKSLQVA